MDLSGWSGARPPERTVLDGAYTRLEPLDPDHHGAQLFRSARQTGADDRFRFLFEEAPSDEGRFRIWLQGAAASNDPLFFAVLDKSTGTAEGRQALMRIDPTHGVVEVGNILWGFAIARSRVATEAFFLFASYVFDRLGYRRLEWKCHNGNEPSKKAAERFGFTFEGVFRSHMVVKGENRDTAWFSIIQSEWPALDSCFRAWLDLSNFDRDGNQKRRLWEFRNEG